MDLGGIRMAPAAASVPLAPRVEPTSSGTKAVATQLPRSDVVVDVRGQASATLDARAKDQQEQAQREALLRSFIQTRIIIRPETREIISRSVDTRTGDVIEQFPDQTTLKLKDYLKAIRDSMERQNTTAQQVARTA
jgi:type IV secretory pathway TrbF-like protein